MGLEPVSAFIMFAGIYYGAMYGGSTTAILLNTPANPAASSPPSTGNEMARKGRGAQALATAAIGSFVAGTIATVGLTFVAPADGQDGAAVRPAEYFALMVLALTTVTAVLGDLPVARPRQPVLRSGAGTGRHRPPDRSGAPDLRHSRTARWHRHRRRRGRTVRDRRDALQRRPPPLREGRDLRAQGLQVDEQGGLEALMEAWLRGTLLGFPIGALPAGGSEIPTFLSYSLKSG